MSRQASAQANVESAAPELTLHETLRVMDVARELRDQRQQAEEMFRRDDARKKLRDKLVMQARMSGDNVTEAEIDAAISQYMENLHTFQPPESGMNNFLAHCWVWRDKMLYGAAALAAIGAGLWYFFG